LRCGWDPIEVGAASADEYDSYAMHLFTALHTEAAQQDVEAYLNWAEMENMGLTQPSGVTAEIASKIIEVHRNLGRSK
jgi:hypothetical protein